MTENNLELWDSVEKTDPAHTKGANVGGNKITCICPQHQIKNATEKFGVYGKTWGFKELNLDYSLALTTNLVVVNAVFFFPDGSFPIINSVKLYKDNACTKVDDDFAKKVETDTLTKALSKLGFNADVFLGKFDDARYVDEVRAEFEQSASKEPKELTDNDREWIAGIKKGEFKLADITDPAHRKHIEAHLEEKTA